MTIFNLGSINIDYFYKLPHLPRAGETLASVEFKEGLGGKGANQSVACGKSGAAIYHIGHIHHKDEAWLASLSEASVHLDFIKRGTVPTGHAIIMIDEASGENQIILMPGANQQIEFEDIDQALLGAKPSDWALCQNETNHSVAFLKKAKEAGLKICYSAAPFVKDHVLAVIDIVDLLVVNEIEAAEIEVAMGQPPAEWGVPHLVITKGAEGADYMGEDGVHHQQAHKVKAVDTTGAGDTYLGFLLGRLSQGDTMKDALAIAAKAAALQVTRFGTADAIPHLSELNLDAGKVDDET